MEINYPIVGIIVLLAICLIVFLIWKNRKDQKKFEQEMIKSDLGADTHKNGEIKT